MGLYLNDNNIKLNGLGSYDVLEHIYNIQDWISDLKRVPSEDLMVLKASGANIRNPRIRKFCMNQAYFNENNDRVYKKGDNEADCYKAYKKVRANIIRESSPELSENIIIELAKLSRGKAREDIIKCVEEYKRTGNMPKEINHPTNTCNPITGSWDENLIDHNFLINEFKKNGFSAKIIKGYYKYDNSIKGYIKRLLNFIIYSLGDYGITFSPFFAVEAWVLGKNANKILNRKNSKHK